MNVSNHERMYILVKKLKLHIKCIRLGLIIENKPNKIIQLERDLWDIQCKHDFELEVKICLIEEQVLKSQSKAAKERENGKSMNITNGVGTLLKDSDAWLN